jgi:hypothetical protein
MGVFGEKRNDRGRDFLRILRMGVVARVIDHREPTQTRRQ